MKKMAGTTANPFIENLTILIRKPDGKHKVNNPRDVANSIFKNLTATAKENGLPQNYLSFCSAYSNTLIKLNISAAAFVKIFNLVEKHKAMFAHIPAKLSHPYQHKYNRIGTSCLVPIDLFKLFADEYARKQ